jgi:hypothetical protein
VPYTALGRKYGVGGVHAYYIVIGKRRKKPYPVDGFRAHAFPPDWQANREQHVRSEG